LAGSSKSVVESAASYQYYAFRLIPSGKIKLHQIFSLVIDCFNFRSASAKIFPGKTFDQVWGT